MSNVFYCGDTHFGHKNIINFTDRITGKRIRPFSSVQEHDQILIDNWNRVVKPTDKVFLMGDVAIPRKGLEVVARLNGRKHLVQGNHDIFPTNDYIKYFYRISSTVVNHQDRFIVTHIPIHPSQLGRFKCNVHGHLHSEVIDDPRYINLSLEHINFTPISHEDLLKLIKEKAGI